jgi:autotransporter strand-loop-strand O-heptosyltransferase
MKIVNVTPGLIPIPPNGWGAVEKIIWEHHQNLLKLGHDSQITYLDDVPLNADIIHIHVANLAILAQERGIPYYFTMHDHHAYLNGKDSWVYKQNIIAMKGAIKSFVPAKYLVEYFENLPVYFSHGVNSEYFIPSEKSSTEHRLLCVANNGYAHDQTIDRKGFGIAIEAAKQLNLPITIAGPSNNKNYFNAHPPTYDKLTIKYDLSEEELLTIYKEHTIFLHPSQLEAGHPNLTLLEALSCGLPIVGTFEGNNTLDGMKVVQPDIQQTVYGIQEIINNYPEYTRLSRNQAVKLDWMNRTKSLVSIYTEDRKTDMKKQLLNHYSNTKPLKTAPIRKFNFNCIDGMFAEILSGPDTKYSVKFVDRNTNKIVYDVEMGRNCWAKVNTKYYVDWRIEIEDKNSPYKHVHDFSVRGNKVYIALDSKSLGDTLAWIPYVEEFRKQRDCKVVCSTFWNDLFIDEYPNIEFVKPGDVVHNIVAMYTIGIFYKSDNTIDFDKHPTHPIKNSLQQIASDILGLQYKEIRPKMKQSTVDNTESKQIVIAIHSTAQSKYWNNPTGWQEIVDWLRGKGYTVKLLSQEPDGYMGNKNPAGIEIFPQSSIEAVIEEIKKSKAFVGISSGLSWVSWATGTPTVMISGFTDPINEMTDCIRISAPEGKCSGCWHRHRFDPGDWNWCPDHKNTPRQFECSRDITADMVIEQLEELLNGSKDNSYAGKLKTFRMIDVVENNPNKQLVMTDEQFWNTIYTDNKYGWWGAESKSGEGSEGMFAEYKRGLIETIISKYDIKSIIDFGCGDFNWMSRVNKLPDYLGIDIVRSLVDSHNKAYGSTDKKFVYGNTANVQFHQDFIKNYGTEYDIGILFDILGHQLWDEIENTLDFILHKLNLKYVLATSQPNYNENYWKEKVSRNESVNIEIHPLMISRGFEIVERFDHDLVLYRLK